MTYSCCDFTDDVFNAFEKGGVVNHETCDYGDNLDQNGQLLLDAFYAYFPTKDSTNMERAEAALKHLTAARDLLKAAGADRTLECVRHAISSAKGGVRAAQYRDRRASR